MDFTDSLLLVPVLDNSNVKTRNHLAQHLAQAPAAKLKFIWHSHNDFAKDGGAERRQVV